MTAKHARELSEAERKAALAELRRGPKPEPMDISKTAKEMTPAERDQFIRECARRFK